MPEGTTARHYRLVLRLRGPLGTPLLSGTLFGHLCWAMRHLEGEQSLTQWLDQLKQGSATPFLISDGFPHNMLPVPVLSTATGKMPGEAIDDKTRQNLEKLKARRKRPYLSLKRFLEIRHQLTEEKLLEALEQDEADGLPSVRLFEHRTAHNTIHRTTGTTPETGGLYFLDDLWPVTADGQPPLWDVYVSTNMPADRLRSLFEHVGDYGYGRDTTTGRGHFTVESIESAPAELFNAPGSRLMSLSHGTLTPNMLQPRYKLHVHYGRLGRELATLENPFKFPIVLLKPGANFVPEDSGPYGRLLEDVSPQFKSAVHNAWHLTVPFSEPDNSAQKAARNSQQEV